MKSWYWSNPPAKKPEETDKQWSPTARFYHKIYYLMKYRYFVNGTRIWESQAWFGYERLIARRYTYLEVQDHWMALTTSIFLIIITNWKCYFIVAHLVRRGSSWTITQHWWKSYCKQNKPTFLALIWLSLWTFENVWKKFIQWDGAPVC